MTGCCLDPRAGVVAALWGVIAVCWSSPYTESPCVAQASFMWVSEGGVWTGQER